MDKIKKRLIKLIVERLIFLDKFEQQILIILQSETSGNNAIDNTFDIGFRGIPLILNTEETDELDNLLYDVIKERITIPEYFEFIEEYIEEEK